MSSGTPLVEIENLSVDFSTVNGALHVLRDVSLTIGKRRIVGLVGESGSGKSTLALALLGLLPANTSDVCGRIALDGKDLLAMPPDSAAASAWQPRRHDLPGPMTALNPVFTLGTQLVDAQRNRHPDSRPQTAARPRRSDAGARRHLRCALAPLGLSASTQRWHAPARHDRHGAIVRTRHPDRRRADDGA